MAYYTAVDCLFFIIVLYTIFLIHTILLKIRNQHGIICTNSTSVDLKIRVRIFTKLYGRGVLCINICIVSEAIEVKLDVSNTGQGRRFYVQIVKIDPTFQVPCLEGLDPVCQIRY